MKTCLKLSVGRGVVSESLVSIRHFRALYPCLCRELTNFALSKSLVGIPACLAVPGLGGQDTEVVFVFFVVCGESESSPAIYLPCNPGEITSFCLPQLVCL